MRVLLCHKKIQVKHCKGQGQLRDLDRFPRSTWTYYQLQLGAAPGRSQPGATSVKPSAGA